MPALTATAVNKKQNYKQKGEQKTMKKWENMKIANEYFEVNTKETEVETPIGYRDIDACYGRCSQTKRIIWNSWVDWFRANNGYCTVASYNCNFFTISGYFTDPATNQRYYAYITASRNKAWKVA